LTGLRPEELRRNSPRRRDAETRRHLAERLLLGLLDLLKRDLDDLLQLRDLGGDDLKDLLDLLDLLLLLVLELLKMLQLLWHDLQQLQELLLRGERIGGQTRVQRCHARQRLSVAPEVPADLWRFDMAY
jgi:hypothetical protein